jgi:hypothetical protein
MAVASEPSWSPARRSADVLAGTAVNPFVISVTTLTLIAVALFGARSAFAVVAVGAFMTGWASAWSP